MSVYHPIFSLSAGLPRLGWFIAVACGLLAQPFAAQADTLADLVDGKPEPHLVAEGFTFTEGPATDAKGDIYFSDIPTGKIHRWKVPAGGVPPAGRRIIEPDWRRVPNFGQHPMHVRVVLGATRTLNEVDPDEPTRDGFQFCQ